MSDAPVETRVSRRSQGLTPVQQVVRYHQETKHQFMRYARSLGFLDWANQPDPFRRYHGARLYPLPLLSPEATGAPRYDDLFVPGRIPPQPVTLASVSRFFEYALSITAWKQAGEVRWALRSNPSSGNLHPTEGYLLARPIDGLAADPGLYHYAAKEHGLELRASVPTDVARRLLEPFLDEAMLVGLSSIHWREAWKYGERAFRYCHHDVGHAIGSARLSAAALGWRMVWLSEMSTDEAAGLLGLARTEDYRGVEREHADCVLAVWPDRSDDAEDGAGRHVPLSLDTDTIAAMETVQWHGRANRLSPDDPLQWDIIDEVTEVTRRPGASPRVVHRLVSPPGTRHGPARPESAHQIIHRRRSAVAFDGKTSVTAAQLYGMLGRLMSDAEGAPGAHPPPWDVGFFNPRIHLALFVHLVDGLTPGLYCLVRDREKLPLLKEKMNPAFGWVLPPECPPTLPLYALAEGDGRRLAAQVSCHQDIAGASAFSLGMLAEFEGPLHREGPGVYPELFWECGLIGQVLYLEAEAAGVQATGIGCFFDDPVHEVLGLTDLTFQSLYHFTVGGAMEDTRLTTLPPYPERRH